MASPILCTTTACGRPATHEAVKNGRRVGFACGQCRIGAGGVELIAARKEQERRMDDIAELGRQMLQLVQLRKSVFSMTPLELSTATLTIGRRFDESGQDAATFVDTTIDMVIAQLQRIRSGTDYDMDIVHKRMAQLRGGLAADASLDDFDAATGFALKKAGMPDDARQLAAYRANPVQIVARLESEMQEDDIDYVVGAARQLLYVTKSSIGFPPQLMTEFKSGKIEVDKYEMYQNARRNPVGWQINLYASDRIAHTSKPNIAYTVPPFSYDYGAYGYGYLVFGTKTHVCLLYSRDQVTFCAIYRTSIDGDTGIMTPVSDPFPIAQFAIDPNDVEQWSLRDDVHERHIAIDNDGNVWHTDKVGRNPGGAVIVRSIRGGIIKTTKHDGVFAIATGDDGIWAASRSPAGAAVPAITYTNYRLVPPAEYNRGMNL